MGIAQTVLTEAAFVPLQLGGDLLWLAIVFLILAVLAGAAGAGGVAGLSMDIAKWLVIIFVILAVLAFLF